MIRAECEGIYIHLTRLSVMRYNTTAIGRSSHLDIDPLTLSAGFTYKYKHKTKDFILDAGETLKRLHA